MLHSSRLGGRMRYGPGAPWKRPQQRRSVASLRALEAIRHRPEDRSQVEGAGKARDCFADLRTGPKEPRSTVLSVEEEAVIIVRRHTLLPLDDCLCAVRVTIPHLTRSSLHRCLQAAWD